jgi:hypothetical protein
VLGDYLYRYPFGVRRVRMVRSSSSCKVILFVLDIPLLEVSYFRRKYNDTEDNYTQSYVNDYKMDFIVFTPFVGHESKKSVLRLIICTPDARANTSALGFCALTVTASILSEDRHAVRTISITNFSSVRYDEDSIS